MPFLFPWTDLPPMERARSIVLHHWRTLGRWTPQDWSLSLTVFVDGEPVGLQAIGAKDFATLREVDTGSWLGLRHHGRGIGTHMRAAVLALAFEHLGAEHAVSAAFTDNASSWRVSEKLGYRPDGIDRMVVRGEVVTARRLRMDRERWRECADIPVTVTGVAECRELFGAVDRTSAAG